MTPLWRRIRDAAVGRGALDGAGDWVDSPDYRLFIAWSIEAEQLERERDVAQEGVRDLIERVADTAKDNPNA